MTINMKGISSDESKVTLDKIKNLHNGVKSTGNDNI